MGAVAYGTTGKLEGSSLLLPPLFKPHIVIIAKSTTSNYHIILICP